MNCLMNVFPDILTQNSDIIGGYTQQLLLVMEYIPELRPQIIQLITEKMILIDVEIEKRERDNRSQNESANNNININININSNLYEIKDPNNGMISDDDSDSVISDQREEDENMDDNGMAIAGIDDDEEDVLSSNLDQLMCLMFEQIKMIADNDNKLLIEIYQIFSRIFETSILSTSEVLFLFLSLCSDLISFFSL